MKRLTQAFRWFGPNDPVKLSDIRQTGATDIVTALHDIPNGKIWSTFNINKRKKLIEDAGLKWSVVESLPVSEEIKTRTADWKKHLDNYAESLKNLAECGIKIITYNFMPVLDWTRTHLEYKLPEGFYTLYFHKLDIIAFDCFVLNRKNAKASYTENEYETAYKHYQNLEQNDINRIIDTVLKGLPGSEESFSLKDFEKMLGRYENIDRAKLKRHHYRFLEAVIPVAERYNTKLVIHPDDPPFDIFGLPRILSTKADLKELFENIPSESNGLCFCSGSFGVREDNDLMQMALDYKDRVHFIHLRSTKRELSGNFYEANHLEGDANIPQLIKVFIQENQTRSEAIPFRPDHGYKMLHEIDIKTNPGYSCLGRMKALAELRGLEAGIIAAMQAD